jgi:predicted ATPase
VIQIIAAPAAGARGGVSIDRRRPAAGESAGPAASAGALGLTLTQAETDI